MGRFCCHFKHVVEGVVRDVFASGSPRTISLAEVGTGFGGSGLHLLSRYAWVEYVGIDALFGVGAGQQDASEIRARFRTYGSRSRLLIPMNTTEAARILRVE